MLLQSVPSAPITSLDATLSALEDVLGQQVVALFALVLSSDIPPVAVGAVVAFSQQVDCLLHHLHANRVVRCKLWLLPLDYLVRTCD